MTNGVDKLIRDMMPETSEKEIRREVHFAILKERLRTIQMKRRKRRTRRFMLFGPVLAVLVVAVMVGPLGGDGFDVEFKKNDPIMGRIFHTKFTEDGFNVSDDATDQEIEILARKFASDDGVLKEADGYEYSGIVYWTITRTYHVDGKEYDYSGQPRETKSEPTRELLEFMQTAWPDIHAEIISGGIVPVSRVEKNLDGNWFDMKVWEVQDENLGLFRYYNGKPITEE